MSSGWSQRLLALFCGLATIAVVACGGSAAASSAVARSSSSPSSAPTSTRLPTSGSRSSSIAGSIPAGDWTTFDYNAQRSGVGPSDTGITAANLDLLTRRTVELDGTVDSSPIELHGIVIDGSARDVIVVTTSYGHTIAIDAETGAKLWEFAPVDVARLQGTYQITASSPVADPDRAYIYAASPDGYIHKLALATGAQVWATRITYDATHEKIPSALNITGNSVIATTDGYIGDIPVYQGHVVLIDRSTGRITAVWNSLCSNIHHLIDPPSACSESDSGIWGRSGTVVEPSGRILVVTGNADFNGTDDWGDSVLELSPTLQLLHNWTPADQADLDDNDLDLGSTEPALLGDVDGKDLAVQGGKDGILRLLDLDRLDGTTGGAGPRTGGELQRINTPGSDLLYTAPAVWTSGGRINVFVADDAGTADYVLGSNLRLRIAWQNHTAGTSPVIAGGLLYVYDEELGLLKVYRPASGAVLASLPAWSGHWNSPIVVGGRIILPVGNDNSHLTSGALYIYHLPGL
ncbi:MAG: PQQ-binding-like beta-propeller repeat protein [Solirubrobacteraceae bacterium]